MVIKFEYHSQREGWYQNFSAVMFGEVVLKSIYHRPKVGVFHSAPARCGIEIYLQSFWYSNLSDIVWYECKFLFHRNWKRWYLNLSAALMLNTLLYYYDQFGRHASQA